MATAKTPNRIPRPPMTAQIAIAPPESTRRRPRVWLGCGAADVRVGILKRLDSRRETVTDLSNLLQLSKPTLLEHLEKLQTAGLVKRIDEGRKWIYYELTDKGRKILHPEKVAITLALASAIVLAAIGAFALISSSGSVLSGP